MLSEARLGAGGNRVLRDVSDHVSYPHPTDPKLAPSRTRFSRATAFVSRLVLRPLNDSRQCRLVAESRRHCCLLLLLTESLPSPAPYSHNITARLAQFHTYNNSAVIQGASAAPRC